MATRNTGSDRRRTRPRTATGTSTKVPPRAGARSAEAGGRAAQAQLLQGVQQGLRLLNQSRSTARRMVRDAFESAQETVQSRVGGARDQAQETLDNLEALFQKRVQRAMHQLGVPTATEIQALTRRVAELNESVRRIETRARGRKTAAAPRPRAKK